MLLEVPFIYQCEVLRPRKRKRETIWCKDVLHFEIPDIHDLKEDVWTDTYKHNHSYIMVDNKLYVCNEYNTKEDFNIIMNKLSNEENAYEYYKTFKDIFKLNIYNNYGIEKNTKLSDPHETFKEYISDNKEHIKGNLIKILQQGVMYNNKFYYHSYGPVVSLNTHRYHWYDKFEIEHTYNFLTGSQNKMLVPYDKALQFLEDTNKYICKDHQNYPEWSVEDKYRILKDYIIFQLSFPISFFYAPTAVCEAMLNMRKVIECPYENEDSINFLKESFIDLYKIMCEHNFSDSHVNSIMNTLNTLDQTNEMRDNNLTCK